MHKTLKRQLDKFLGTDFVVPEEWKGLIDAISLTYQHSDEDRDLIERSLDLSSKEMIGSGEKLKISNRELLEARKATLNLFEDLKQEKEEVDKKVKERTADLEIEKGKLFHVTENIKTGAILLDSGGKVLLINKSAKLILGEEVDGKNVLKIFDKKFPKEKISKALKSCVKGSPAAIPEAEASGKIYKITFQCLADTQEGAEAFFGHLILIQDITEEKILERSKSEFVAIASHQLRTPLTVTKGNVEMILDETFGSLNDEQRDILTQTSQANQKLINLVHDMLDTIRMERGELIFTNEKLDLEELIKSVIGDLKEYSTRHGVEIIFKKPAKKIPEIRSDKLRLKQVFQNLLDNGIRYNRHPCEGKCKVEVSVKVETSQLEISIADNGIGIPAAEQHKIFERFYRASNAVRFSSGGTGLGSYIVKAIVEKLGGKIWFDSTEGKGTTFHFTLPINGPKK